MSYELQVASYQLRVAACEFLAHNPKIIPGPKTVGIILFSTFWCHLPAIKENEPLCNA